MRNIFCYLLFVCSIFEPVFCQTLNYNPERLVVKVKKGHELPSHPLIKNSYELFPSVYILTTGSLFSLEHFLRQNLNVEFIDRDWIAPAKKIEHDFFIDSNQFDDDLLKQQYSLQDSSRGGMDILNAYKAYPQKGSEVIVAIIDTGIDVQHPDLYGNIWINSKEIAGNGLDDDQNGHIDDVRGLNTVIRNTDGRPTVDVQDSHGHGTHVAGIVGAVQDNFLGVAGVARNVKLMTIRAVPNKGDEKDIDIAEGLVYAAKMGAKIINCSFAKEVNEGGLLIPETLKYLKENFGVLVIVAAGNESYDLQTHNTVYPAVYNNDNLIVVASSDKSGKKSSFSNYGLPYVDVAAPGSGVLSTYLGSDWRKLDGTSMASPNVAGVAAEILSQHPQMDVLTLKRIIMESVVTSPDWKNVVVSGGRVNLKAALDKASSF